MASSGIGSPMKGGSTASSASGSRGHCPFCMVPLIRIQSKQKDTKDQWFVKCPYNVKGDPSTCSFIKQEVEYDGIQARDRRLQLKGEWVDELKEELNVLRQVVECIGSDVWKLKKQVGEAKEEDAKNKGKFEIVVDPAALAPLFLVLLGAIVGVVGVLLWKQ